MFLAVAIASVLAPQALVLPALSPTAQVRSSSPHMGFFDDLKKGFENDPRLEEERQATNAAGKSKKAPAYVKKQQPQNSGQQKGAAPQGDRTWDEIFSGWKW